MENVPPRVVIDPEDAIVRILAPGSCIVLTGVEQMRSVRDSLTEHISLLESEHTGAVHRTVPVLPLVGRELLAAAYAETFERDGDHERHEYTEPDRVKWFDTGTGPGWEVTP